MLAIVTVIYQNYTVLEDFFVSLKNQTDKNYHLFIVDASVDRKEINTVGLPVTVINIENKGYAYAVNKGLERAVADGFDKFAIVNSDIVFDSNFVKNAHLSIEKNPVAIIGGKIYYAPGYEYHKDRYAKEDSGRVIWYAGGKIDWAHVLASHRGVDEVDRGQYDAFAETDFITGCLVCYDLDVHRRVGMWDADYFMYYEDTDFSMRAKKAGVKCLYDPSIVIWHKNAQSTDGAGSEFHVKYQKKNRIKFGLKYAPLRTKLHLIKELLVG